MVETRKGLVRDEVISSMAVRSDKDGVNLSKFIKIFTYVLGPEVYTFLNLTKIVHSVQVPLFVIS